MSGDWLRTLEQKVRRMGEELPIDVFLPELDSGHLDPSSVAPAPRPEAVAAEPAPPPAPELRGPTLSPASPQAVAPEPAGAAPGSGEEWVPGVPISDREDGRPRKRRRKRAAGSGGSSEPTEEEIREYMKRNERGTSEDDDMSDFLGQGIDPNLD